MWGRTSLLKPVVVLLSVSLVVHLSAAAGVNVSFADTVWNVCRPEALNALYSPFVVSLAAGNLDFETYVQYIYQDIQFGKGASEASAYAMEYTNDTAAKEIFNLFMTGDGDAAKKSQEWLDQNRPNATYPINDATIDYINFMNDTVHGIIEGYPEPFTGPIVSVFSMACLIPCWKLYYFIGKQIVAAVGDYKDNPYKDWIEGNAADSLRAKLETIDGVFQNLAANLTLGELAIVEQVYRKGMTCEVEFFLAQPLFQYTSVPLTRDLSNATERLLMFSGFDGTTNVVDSSVVLANLAISSASNKTEAKATWGRLFSQYKEEYGLGVENISNSAQAEEFHYYTVSKALEIFSYIEKANILRVNQSGALAGIQAEAVATAGEDAILLQDFITFFQRIATRQNLNSSANVISTSWSASLVEAAFSSGMYLPVITISSKEDPTCITDRFHWFRAVGLTQLQVHANELAFEESVSTGGIIDAIVSPADRVSVLAEIVNQYSDQNRLTVYVGESVEELLSLLSVDIGIVVGPSSSLKRVGTQLGVTFRSLFSASISVQEGTILGRRPDWTASQGVLFTVSSWTEIDAFILGWDDHFDIVESGARKKSRLVSPMMCTNEINNVVSFEDKYALPTSIVT